MNPFSTLKSRLLLTIVLGIILAVVVSSLLFWQDKGRSLRLRSLDYALERVAATVRLLERPASPRQDILRLVRSRPFRAQLLPAYMPVESGDAVPSELLERLQSNLAQGLGEQRRYSFQMMEFRYRKPNHHGREQGKSKRPRLGMMLIVELEDGAAVQFTYAIPPKFPRPDGPILYTLGTLLMAAVLIAWLVIRQIARPLQRISEHALKIGASLDAPVLSETGPQEVARVAQAMNAMQRQLKTLFDERSQFLAAVSHDLRTPITRLRLRAELIDDPDIRAKFLNDLGEMEVMTQQTLDNLREANARESVQKVDLSALLDALIDDIRMQSGKDLRLEAQPQVVSVRLVSFKRAINNLLQNAVVHGDEIVVRLFRDENNIHIEISDNGPGIPSTGINRVFEPFYRLDEARNSEGSGLGLSIARGIIRAHGGDIELENRSEGGLVATIHLPAEF